jgi:ATP-dependent DNA helicase RecG
MARMELHLDTKLADCAFLDATAQKALAAGGFISAGQLLKHFPFRYEDRRQFVDWPRDSSSDPVALHGTITDAKQIRHGYRRAFVEITIEKEDAAGMMDPVVLRFFNMPWIYKLFAAGQEIVAYGKVKRGTKNRLVIDHPEYEILTGEAEEARIHMQRIVPVYHARESVPQKVLRAAVFALLERIADEAMPDTLPPPSDAGDFARMSKARAVRQIHFPESMDEMDGARRYLALEEFFALQLNVLRRRHDWHALQGAPHCGAGELYARWRDTLAFSLTKAQDRAIAEIRADLTAPRAMNRMLQGDVGSGKTFVALAAMLFAVESGCQAVLMAPTQILAEQHYLNFRRWLEPLGVRIALRTGSRKEDAAMPLFTGGEDAPQILIGTHALLTADTAVSNLGLVVIDEQHKFGVEQRARLVRQGRAPDVLVMTATPIPRTLTMTVYGDLDVSILDEIPAGRQPIVTAVREEPDAAQVAAFLREQFAAGRQAYLVFPLVEESGKLDVRAVTVEFEKWKKRLAPHEVALLHGRVPAEEKETVMARVRSGEVRALCATSVIEVGVDVPNATVMIVFDAERFGLAQLHQLRGRVGRGAHKSYCILVASGKNPEAVDRLRTLEKTTDGFAVAEADLMLRGPGDLLGTAQSGLPGLQLGDLVRDARLVRTARRLASEILAADPRLEREEHAHFRPLLLTSETMTTLS